MLLKFGGIDFKDTKLSREEFGKLKPSK